MLQDAGIDQSQQQRRADADHDGALAQGPLQPSLLPSLARRWRLPHLMIAANACQLVLMIAFLALLLARLKESFVGSWFFVFIPLWGSDAITFVAGVIEMRRLLRADTDPTTCACCLSSSSLPRLVSECPPARPTAGTTSGSISSTGLRAACAWLRLRRCCV